MASATKKSTKRKKSARADQDALMLDLAAEYQRLAFDIQSQVGISVREGKRIYKLARSKRAASTRTSDKVLTTCAAMSDILAEWLRNPRYVGSDGSPKTLPVHGKGVTFESLVQRHIAQMPVTEAVDFLIAHSDARRQSGDRIALLGSNSLILDRAKEVTLAIIIQRMRRLAMTVITNQDLPQADRSQGRYERQVTGYMTQAEWEEFSGSIRPQLQDCVDHFDERVEEARPATTRERFPCGLTMFLWADFTPRPRK